MAFPGKPEDLKNASIQLRQEIKKKQGRETQAWEVRLGKTFR